MPDNTKQYTNAEVQAMIKAYEKQKQSLPPEWFLDSKLNELIFAECLRSEYPMVCINQLLYTIDGMPVDIPTLRSHIMEKLTGYVSTDIPKRISRIIETLKIKCHTSMPAPQLDRIHMRNGTLFLNGTFTANTEFSINRIPLDYNPDAPLPETFLKYVHDLLEPVDIQTLQEYMGLCFLPTNKAQKMLMILGNGGEGKSRLGIILNMLFGPKMITGSVQRLETDRFARANLENKLLLYDDDMVMEALPATHNLKTLITLEGNTEVERKGKQSYQAPIYARFFAVGNGSLSALHDRSDGFFRRQLILYARPKESDRIDDPFLTEKIGQEIEGIFLWCLEGLKRLIANDYKFTISDKAKQNLQELMEDSNNILSFMKSSGFIRLEANTHASSRQLYAAYTSWCEANCIKPMSPKTLTSELKQNAAKYGLTYSNNIDAGDGKKVRGFYGIHTIIRTD